MPVCRDATHGAPLRQRSTEMNTLTTLPRLLLNVPALANKPQAEAERILGRPERTSGTMVSQREKRAYRQGKVEVVYVEGKANWIKLYDTSGLRFSQSSLSRLGLPPKRPTYVNRNHVMSWSKICNLKEVSFYSDGNGGVSSVLVCVRSTNPGDEEGDSEGSRKRWTRNLGLGSWVGFGAR